MTKQSSFVPEWPGGVGVLVSRLALPDSPKVSAAAEPLARIGKFPRDRLAVCLAVPASVEIPFGMNRVPYAPGLPATTATLMEGPVFPVQLRRDRLVSTVVWAEMASPVPVPAVGVLTASCGSGNPPVMVRTVCGLWMTASGCLPAESRHPSETGICATSTALLGYQRAWDARLAEGNSGTTETDGVYDFVRREFPRNMPFSRFRA